MALNISETLEQERREWEDLLRSAGWQRFLARCAEEYNADAQLQRIDKLLDGTQPADATGQAGCAREIRIAAKAVMAMLEYPKQRVRKLEQDLTPVDPPLVPRRA